MQALGARKNIEDIYPLSPIQQGMLFHAVKAPGSGVYVEQMTARLDASLDTVRLRAAWSQVIDRHGVLRTLFVADRGKQPLQIVRQRVEIPWTEKDWQTLAESGADRRLAELLHQDRVTEFRLDRAPLLRFCLIAWPDGSWRFVWTFHHLLLDGWSAAQVLEEVRAAYSGRQPAAAAPSPYRAFITWLGRQDQAPARDYWRAAFRGFESPASLAPLWLDETETIDQVGYRRERVTIPPATVAALETLARTARVTPNTIFQGAWACLLARFSGENDLAFGVTVAGRPAEIPDAGAMIGLFINTLPMRVRLDEAAPLDDWLQSIQTGQAEARRFEHSALTDVRRWTGVSSAQSLFETLLVFENHPVREITEGSELMFDAVEFHEQSNYPLSLLVVPGNPWRLILISDSTRVSAGAARTWLDSLMQVLTCMVDGTARRVGEVMACSPQQQAELAAWGRGPEADWPALGTVCEEIRSNCLVNPRRTALVQGTKRVDYGVLGERIAAIAGALRNRGVGAGDLVPVYGARDLDTVTSLLAVQAAGAGYLPLDASYPDGRISEILSAVPAPALSEDGLALTTRRVPGGLMTGLTWLESPRLERGSEQLGDAAVSGDGLAYVIFTSGSTGGPKGVPVRHRNLAWSNRARMEYYGGTPRRFLLLSPLGFDSSVVGLFWTLAGGGVLVLPTEDEIASPLALADLLRREKITHLLCLPSLWAVLLDALPDSVETALTQVIVAGESCPPSLPRLHRKRLPGVRLDNEYGPTEATVWCTAQRLDLSEWRSAVPIGRPVPGAFVEVRDAQGRLAPPGALGELHAGGPGVVEGYLNDPDLSASAFRRGDGQQGGIYRTGDRVRYSGDGTLVFIGRMDDQVKVRGYRIEPQDLETVLVMHPAVRACGVVAKGGAELLALVEPVEDGDGDKDGLRDWLRQRLPGHLLPDRIVWTTRLPVLPSGKLDRRRLAGVLDRGTDVSGQVWTPTDGTEATLARLWQDVLQSPAEAWDSSFFESGGHSLLSMRLLVELERRLSVRVSLAGFLADPTPRGLTELVRARGAASQWRSLIPVKASGTSLPFFCIHGDPTALAPHLDSATPYYWLHHAQAGGNVTYASVETLAEDHLAEIRGIWPKGPYRLAGFSFGGLIAFEAARKLVAAGEEVSFLGLIEPTLPKGGDTPDSGLMEAGVDEEDADPSPRAFALRFKRLRKRARRKVKMNWCEHYIRSGRTLPADLRDFYLVQLFAKAGRAYTYPEYSGSAVLFVTAETAANAGRFETLREHWRGVCEGGVEMQVAGGVPSHTDLFREPYVSALARLLNARLRG